MPTGPFVYAATVQPLAEPFAHPFHLPGRRAHALLVHGFTATPFEMFAVGQALSAADIGAHGMLLPGHGTHPDALWQVSVDDWVAAIASAFAALPNDAPRFIVASSMGAALSLHVAAHKLAPGVVSGMVLFAPALALHKSGKTGALLARAGLHHLVDDIKKAEPGGDVAAPDAKATNNAYPVLTVRGVRTFLKAMALGAESGREVTWPLCVFHGVKDRTIALAASERLCFEARSARVEFHRLPQTRHIVALDHERDHVAKTTCTFLDRVLTDLEAAR